MGNGIAFAMVSPSLASDTTTFLNANYEDSRCISKTQVQGFPIEARLQKYLKSLHNYQTRNAAKMFKIGGTYHIDIGTNKGPNDEVGV